MVTGRARHTETGECMVLYQPLYEMIGGPKTWARPLSMWHELVDGKPRFEQTGTTPRFHQNKAPPADGEITREWLIANGESFVIENGCGERRRRYRYKDASGKIWVADVEMPGDADLARSRPVLGL